LTPRATRLQELALSQRCHNWVRIGGLDRRQQETVCAGQKTSRHIAKQRNPADVRLGVKWSQVQILTARPQKALRPCEVRTKYEPQQQHIVGEQWPLAQWIGHWAESTLEASPRKNTTKALYRSLATKHLMPAPLGTTPLDKLRKSHIDALLVKLRKAELSDSTVRQVYTILRAILDDAKLDGLIADNPATRVPRPRIARKEARHLAAADVTAVLAAAEGLRYRNVLVLIAATGLRRGEALALRWSDVDLEGGCPRTVLMSSLIKANGVSG
jgi:integrase